MRLKHAAGVIALACSGAAPAQTPLCAWNGASLTCPTSAPPPTRPRSSGVFDPLARMARDRDASIAEARARANLDGSVLAERVRQDEQHLNAAARAEQLANSGQCREAEALARQRSDIAALARVQTACAGQR